MKNVLIICYSPLHRDPRVITQINALKNYYNITCGGYTNPNIEGIKFITLSPPRGNIIEKLLKPSLILFNSVAKAYWIKSNKNNLLELERVEKIDIIISNELNILPIAIKLTEKYKCNLILDAHEYYPGLDQGNGLIGKLNKIFILQMTRKYFRHANYVTTVGENINKLYKEKFNISSETVMNLPIYVKQDVKNTSGKIRLVHHGNAMPKRELERMIDIMNFLDDSYTLTFYLMVQDKNQEYYRMLKENANKIKKEIYFKDPIPTNKIPFELNSYDIGVYILPPTNINNKYALPNKLFEFIQARLAIAIGPSPEMARIVTKYSLGVVSEEFTSQSLAKKIKSLDIEDILTYKKNADSAASPLSSQVAMNQWRQIINKYV